MLLNNLPRYFYEVSILEDTQKRTGQGPEQPELTLVRGAGWLDYVTSRAPFQPQRFYDECIYLQEQSQLLYLL